MSDKCLYSFYETSSDQSFSYPTMGEPKQPDWADTIKITSQCQNMVLHAEQVYGGQEDCVDINNRSQSVTVMAGEWIPQGKYLATIKGGAKSASLAGRVVSHGSEVDVDLGNWSDQSQEITGTTILDLQPTDGKPITVRVLHAVKPYFVASSGPYRYVFPHPDAWYHGLVVKAFYLWCKLTK